MRRASLVLALAVACSPGARAQDSATPANTVTAPVSDGRVLDTAVVRAPGPGFWKVSHGDHVMWVLGTVSPLPAGLQWNSARMRSIVAGADAVIAEPNVTVDADIGFFGKLALLPSLIGVRALPDGQHLVDVLPAPLYARWVQLKDRYIGSDRGVEEYRPIFAANQLYQAALKRNGLSTRNVVFPAVAEAVKARGLKQVVPSAKLTIAQPKAVVRDFKRTNLADTQCFQVVLDRVENDLDTIATRANAWALGDVAALRALQRNEPGPACEDVLLNGAFARKYGLDRLQGQAEAKWIAEVESSLARNPTTFAVLPMRELLSANGLLARLAAKGYRVDAPDAPPAVAPAATPQAMTTGR